MPENNQQHTRVVSRAKNRTKAKMRKAMIPCIAVALSTALVYLTVVPQVALGNPALGLVGTVATIISILQPILTNYLHTLRKGMESGAVEVKLWTQTDDPNMEGCGFYLEATSGTGKRKNVTFPDNRIYNVEDGRILELQVTDPSAMYKKTIFMGNDQITSVEFHAAGFKDTYVKTICIGLSEESIVRGPRAVCIDSRFLNACQLLMHSWNDIDLAGKGIKMTRTARGIHKIVFRDIEQFVNDYERVMTNSENVDAEVLRSACGNIDLVIGDAESDNWMCLGKEILPGTDPISH